ncbi:LamG domain-containing protein [Candidatus Pacearchaeota archaeon]|nr:LamG domain-containing protein [Candidatus Pacearchaeota archaeon]
MKGEKTLVVASIFFVSLMILSVSVSAFSLSDFFDWFMGKSEKPRLSPEDSGLILYIPFNDSINDVTRNYDASCPSGKCPVKSDGKVNNSYKFDGVDDYVRISDDGQFSFRKGENYTLSTWVSILKRDTKKAFPAIIQKWEDGELKNIPFAINYENSTGKILCGIRNDSTSVSARSNEIIQEDQWNMITCVYNSTDILIYVNGILNNRAHYAGLSGDLTNTNDIWIGSISRNYGFLNASIDDLRIYNKALTSEEITALYSAVIPASTTCPDNQTILRLSATTNAHASLWDKSDYPVKVCYDTIFGKQYTRATGENVHECKTGDTNKIINLSADINAQASVSGDYATKVCYGDLVCRNITGTQTCNANEELIVSLSSSENAHLSSGNDYPIKLCCSSVQAIQVTEICNNQVDDDNDNLIDCADIADCGNNPACLQTGNCDAGETLCSDGVCRINCGTLPVNCNNNNICESGPLNNESCQCSDCHGLQDACATNLVCSFRTNTCQPCPQGTTFNPTDGTCANDGVPSIQIITPGQWQRFKTNVDISFNQTSSNLRKNLNITWHFGNGQIKRTEGNCLTTGNCNTTYKYPQQAHYLVKAIAREQGGTRTAEDFVDILVYKPGINVFAVITNPARGESIEGNRAVYFNASRSFVSNCTIDACPSGQSCYNVGNLRCFDLPKPPKQGESGTATYKFWFNWTFFDEDNNQEANLLGTWNNNYRQVVEFHRAFPGENERHTASLMVGYEQI